MFFRAAIVVTFALLIYGCSKNEQVATDRVAVLPFENLSSDRSLDWFGRALSGMVASQVAAKTLDTPRIIEANLSSPTHTLYGYFHARNGRVEVTALLRDEAKTVRAYRAASNPNEIVRVATDISKLISTNVIPFGTTNVDAIREYYRAFGASPTEGLPHLERAIAADPSFGAAQIARAQLLSRAGEPEAAGQAIQAASSARLTPEDSVRLALLRSGNDSKARTEALRRLGQLRPSDPALWQSLAELNLQNKNYSGAIAAYRHAIEIDERSPALWNAIGYAQAFAGDLDAAKKSFDEYRRIAPNDANAIDSLGEVHYYAGRFQEAERYFLEAFQKNSALLGGGDLYRAALCRLLLGDLGGANAHFQKYVEFRKKGGDTFTPLGEALWKFSIGRRKEAVAALNGMENPNAQLARVLVQTQLSNTHQPLIPLPQDKWPGYSLLLSRKFDEAVPLWRGLYDSTSANNASEERVFLAWALLESGQRTEAAKLLEPWPLPPPAPEPVWSTLLFPRVLFLRAQAQSETGNRAGAERLYKLFLQYSGDLDLAFNEETRARQTLASK